MANDPAKLAAPDVPSTPATVDDAAPSVMAPEVIPTEAIPVLQGVQPRTDPAILKPGTALVGDEEPKGQVTIRTRYPVDSFTAGDVTITAAGVDVKGADLAGLVSEATANGVALERI